MTNRLFDPWTEVIISQFRILQRTTEVVASTFDPHRLLDRHGVTGDGPDLARPRLNPLEFHGKRRSTTLHGRTSRRDC